MKRRKQSGPPTGYESKRGHRATKQSSSNDIVALLTEQAARTEIKEKLFEGRQRRPKGPSKQPPPSDEMKNVMEIGGLRWKLGRTK